MPVAGVPGPHVVRQARRRSGAARRDGGPGRTFLDPTATRRDRSRGPGRRFAGAASPGATTVFPGPLGSACRPTRPADPMARPRTAPSAGPNTVDRRRDRSSSARSVPPRHVPIDKWQRRETLWVFDRITLKIHQCWR